MRQLEESEIRFLKSVFIFERFAVAFSKNNEINKTRLHLESRLCWNLFNRYLNLLMKKGYVRHERRGRVATYSLTEEGMRFFSVLEEFLSCIR